MKKLRNKKGFTLIELIVVIAILAILAAILVPAILNYVDTAEQRTNETNARTFYSELSIAGSIGDAEFSAKLADTKYDDCTVSPETPTNFTDIISISCGTDNVGVFTP